MTLRSLHVLVVALGVALAAPIARAADPSPTDIAIAKKLFAEATADEEAERWADGLAKLERVVAIKETAGVRFHIALCEEHLGKLLAARASYDRSSRLAEKLAGAEAKQIVNDATAAIVRIEGRLPTLTVNVPGAAAGQITVKIDGTPLDAAKVGQAIRHDPGGARIEATAPGKRAFEKSVVLVDRASVSVEIVLENETVAQPQQASSPAPASAPPPARERTGGGVPTAAWITGGAALASAGASVYWLVHRASLQSDTDSVCADPYVRCDRAARDGRASTYLVGGLVGAGAAVVLGGVTAFLVVRGDGGASASVGVGPGGVAVGGRF